MARRRRRRFTRRVRPDMAWVVGEDDAQMVFNQTDPFLTDVSANLLAFTDITSDFTGVSREKADWMIKRILLDVYIVGTLDQPVTNTPFRVCEWILFTMDQNTASDISVDAGDQVIISNVYDKSARVLQVGTTPAANSALFGTTGNLRQSVDDPGTNVHVGIAHTPWGVPTRERIDIKPNTTLREDQALFFALGAAFSGDFWESSDTVNALLSYRILLQARGRSA